MAQHDRPAKSSPFERTGFLPIIKQWWWLLILAAVIAGAAASFFSSRSEPVYESRVQLLVGPINTDLDTQRAAGQLAQTYVELATSRPVIEGAIEELALPISPGLLRANLAVTANPTTRVLTIRFRGASAIQAQAIATALANNVAALAQPDIERPEGQLSIFDPAQPGGVVGVDRTMIVALAAVAGILGIFALILLVEYLRNAVRSEGELADLAGSRSLGYLDDSHTSRDPHFPLIVQAQPASRAAGFYRMLAAEIEFLDPDRFPRTLLVLGVQGGEASGALAANLAATFVASGKRVTLVDANYGEAEITSLFRLGSRSGLTDLLTEPGTPEGGVRFWRPSRSFHPVTPDILPLGAADVPELVEPDRLEQVLALLQEHSELVVVNADPVRSSALTLNWARSADVVLLVGAVNRAKRERVTEAAEGLRLVGANLAGTVLSKGRSRFGAFGRGSDRASVQEPVSERERAPRAEQAGDVASISSLPTTGTPQQSRSRGGAS